MYDVSGSRPVVLWKNNAFETHFGSFVLLGGYIYGIDGDARQPSAGTLHCVEALSGKEAWSARLGFVSLIASGGRLIMLNSAGTIIASEASASGCRELGRASLPREAPAHRVAAFQDVLDRFMKQNPNITVKQEVVMWGDAWVKSLSALEAGTLPAFQFSIPDLTLTMYKAGALAPITDLVKEIDSKYNIFPNQKNMFLHEGQYWGLPIFTMVMLMTYRPSFLEEFVGAKTPPDTWEETLDYAKKITEASNEEVYGIGIGGAKNLMTDEQAYVFMASAGARFFDQKGNLIFNSPKTKQALSMYKQLIKYAPPGAEAWSWGEIELNLAAGTLAMSPYFASIQKRFHEEFDSDDYAAAHVPRFKGNDFTGTITYPNEIHIYKQTMKDPRVVGAVKDLVRFMMQPEINAILTSGQEPGGFFPATTAAARAAAYWNNPIVKRYEGIHRIAFEALEKYATLYGFEYGKWVNIGIGDITGADVLAETVNKIVSGQMSVDAAMAWGQAQMEKYSKPVGK